MHTYIHTLNQVYIHTHIHIKRSVEKLSIKYMYVCMWQGNIFQDDSSHGHSTHSSSSNGTGTSHTHDLKHAIGV